MEFYQYLSGIYDEMTGFTERLNREQEILSRLLKKYPARSALDAGCGTAVHALALANLGVTVSGIDLSDRMIKQAKQHAAHLGHKINFLTGDLRKLTTVLTHKFDAIFCLGNTFVHFLSEEDRLKVLYQFRKILNPGGYGVIQVLNYDKILNERISQVAQKNINGKNIERLYRFSEINIIFQVRITEGKRQKVYESELYPVRSNELAELLRRAGFQRLELKADLAGAGFRIEESTNLCIIFFAD